ncbi:MAG TPA: ABC transporter transmembrane domain-containing protein [Burkholderiales bacterium]|nr:ABC transporter transmembrane domain-containing protein [Burkholderiales bacterium]
MALFQDHLPDRPGSRDWAQFARLARFLAPYKLRLAGALVALLLAAGCVLALGQGLRYVIDAGFGSASRAILNQALAAVLVLAVVLACATYARFYLMMTTGERVVADIRRAVFDHVLRLAPSYFESTRTGEVISRLTNDSAVLQAVIGYGFSMALRNALLLAGALVLLAWTNLKLTLIVLALGPLVVVPVLLLGRRLRRESRLNQDRIAEVTVSIDEALHEVRTVQAYVHEEHTRREFAERVEAAYAAGVARIGVKAGLIALVMLVIYGGVGLILWIGGRDVLGGRLSAGDLSAFVFYCAVAAGAVAAVSEVMGDLQRAAGATERLIELLATVPTIVAPPAAPLPARAPRSIEFDAVGFAYPARPQLRALERFTLRIAAGERVALVGPSGAGKSTVLALLLRFYDPQSGAIRLDGVDLRAMDPLALRRLVAVVPQEPVVFAASVLENVRYGRPDASRAEVERACEQAFALEFIERLPQGLDTPLGERGVTLSGGQRQRVSIGRALLADRPILLLDEATSSLDAASERMVQQALEALERGRTTLVIAHRLATVQHADRIVVLDQGRVVAEGSHAELMRQGGLYASLAALQFLHGGGAPPAARAA